MLDLETISKKKKVKEKQIKEKMKKKHNDQQKGRGFHWPK